MFGKPRTIKFDFSAEDVINILTKKLQDEGSVPDGDYYIELSATNKGTVTISFGPSRK